MLTERLPQLIRCLDAAHLGTVPDAEQAGAILDCLDRVPLEPQTFTQLSFQLLQLKSRSAIDIAEFRRMVLWETTDYQIEALVWLGYDTGVHNHAFSGAVQVLTGESLTVNFGFEPRGGSNDLRWGNLIAHGIRRVRAGDLFVFRPDGDFIHKVIHLNRECISLRVLSQKRPDQKQWSYRSGGLAFLDEPVRRAQLVAWAPLLEESYRHHPPAFREKMEWLFANGYRAEGLNFLAYCLAKYSDYAVAESLLVGSPHFTAEEKTQLLPRMASLALETVPVRGGRLSPETELFLTLAIQWGLGESLYDNLGRALGGPVSKGWLTERLMEIAMSPRVEAGVARTLLARFSEYDRQATFSDEVPEQDFIAQAWQTDKFGVLLERCL